MLFLIFFLKWKSCIELLFTVLNLFIITYILLSLNYVVHSYSRFIFDIGMCADLFIFATEKF